LYIQTLQACNFQNALILSFVRETTCFGHDRSNINLGSGNRVLSEVDNNVWFYSIRIVNFIFKQLELILWFSKLLKQKILAISAWESFAK